MAVRAHTLLERRASIRLRLEGEAPEYLSLISDEIVEAASIQSALSEKDVFLQYTLVGGDYFGIALNTRESMIINLGPASLINDQDCLKSGRPLIRGNKTGTTPLPMAAAEQAYRSLIDPFRKMVLSAERAVIIPNARLSALPFSIIGSSNGERLSYLGLTHSLVFSPSASSWMALLSDQSAARELSPFLGVGHPRIGQVTASDSTLTKSAL